MTGDYAFNPNTDLNYTDGILIDKDNFTIDGKGYTIDAGNQARIFNIAAKNVTLKNINFINGNASGDGGAIFSQNSLDLIGCRFESNNAGASGGAVFVSDGLTDSRISSTFISNSAFNGGAIYSKGSHFTNNLIDSYFENNTAERAGGAVYIMGNAVNNTFASEFYGNDAKKASGGGVFFYKPAGGNVFESVFSDNHACYGGGMFFYNAADGNTFSSNFTSNVAESCGGAMFFYSTTDANSFSGSFKDNKALGKIDEVNGNGGAITFKNNSSNSVFDCDFTNNTAAKDGGALNFRTTPLNITFNSDFTGNTANRGGGINFFETFENAVFNSVFKENNATYGGGICIDHGKITNANFIDNTAKYGGAIYFNGTGEVNDVEFTGNDASEGGAIFVCGNLKVSDSAFEDNHADDGTNQISLNATATVTLDNVDPEYVGPYKIADLSVAEVTEDYIRATVTWKGNPVNEGNVSVSINNRNYTVKVENGNAEIDISDLPSGNYTADVCFDGGEYYNTPNRTVSLNVPMHEAIIIAPDAVLTLKDAIEGYKYMFRLADENGNALSNRQVMVSFNGKNQSVTTNENGFATVTLYADEKGVFNVELAFAGDDRHSEALQNATVTVVEEAPDSGKTSDKQVSISLMPSTGNPFYGAMVIMNLLLIIGGIFASRNKGKD